MINVWDYPLRVVLFLKFPKERGYQKYIGVYVEK